MERIDVLLSQTTKQIKRFFLIANASYIPEISPLLTTVFYLAIEKYEKNAYKAIVCQLGSQWILLNFFKRYPKF